MFQKADPAHSVTWPGGEGVRKRNQLGGRGQRKSQAGVEDSGLPLEG